MKVLVICANPSQESFCAALAQTSVTTLQALGAQVVYHDLYQESFPPTLPYGEADRNSEIPDIIRQHCEALAQADGIVIIHPNWWGQPPAILKGWIDRVVRVDVAYRFCEGDNGEGVPEGLLKAKAAIVFNTSNTEASREQQVFGDPLDTIWRNCIFGLCGVAHVERRMYGVIVTSSLEQRKAWLEEAAEVIRDLFG